MPEDRFALCTVRQMLHPVDVIQQTHCPYPSSTFHQSAERSHQVQLIGFHRKTTPAYFAITKDPFDIAKRVRHFVTNTGFGCLGFQSTYIPILPSAGYTGDVFKGLIQSFLAQFPR